VKIVPILQRYDYGIKSRGDSPDYKVLYPALKQITDDVYPFWYDEYLTKKDELQKRVITFVDDVSPDIVYFTLMRDEFSFETLDYLKSKYITINWFWDDQWRFENFTRYYAPHFTYSVTTDKFALSKYKKIGYKNVILPPPTSFGCSENIDFEVEAIKYKYDVSFVGGISGYRKWVIKELLKRGIKVECFGAGWENGRVSFDKMAEIFKTSKINLNISNSASYDIRYIFSSIKSLREFVRTKKRVEQIKARNFEIPAFGGFQLTNYAPSLEDYFVIGREVAVYTSIEDLVLQINYYLDNEEERREIMITGYKRAMKEGTYLDRLKGIFEKMEAEL
jgi:spore maturation protein CgeB